MKERRQAHSPGPVLVTNLGGLKELKICNRERPAPIIPCTQPMTRLAPHCFWDVKHEPNGTKRVSICHASVLYYLYFIRHNETRVPFISILIAARGRRRV